MQGRSLTRTSIVFALAGWALYGQMSLQDSLQYFNERDRMTDVIRIARRLRTEMPHDTDVVINSFYQEGAALRTLSRFEEAETALKEGLRWAPPQHPDRIDLLAQLSAILTDRGDLAGADSLQKDAYRLAHALQDSTRLKRLLTAMSYTAYYKDDFHAMAAYSRELLQITGDSRSPHDVIIQYAALTNLGLALVALGRAAEAETYLRQAWVRSLISAPPASLRARIAENLGIALNEQDRSDEALHFYKIAEEIYRKTGDSLGLSHLYNNIAKSLAEIGDEKASNDYLWQAALLAERYSGEKSPILPNIYLNIAQNALAADELDTAEVYAKKAIEAAHQLRALGVEAYIQVHLGDIHRRKGQWDAAREAYHRAFSLADSVMESGNPLIPILLTRMGLLALHEGNLTEAESNLREANYRFTRYMYSSVSPYSQEVLGHYAALALMEEKAGHLKRSDSLIIETVQRGITRLQLYLPALSPAQRAYAIDKFLRPYYVDLHRRLIQREDSDLVSFGLWTTYIMEFLESFSLSDSLLADTTEISQYLNNWKVCIVGYNRAEREKKFMLGDSLIKEAQKYQTLLWKKLNLPSVEATSFFDVLQRRLPKREALVKITSVKVDGKNIHIGYVVVRRRKGITLRRVVFGTANASSLSEVFQAVKAVLPKSIQRLRVFTPIALPEEFQKGLEATTGATVSIVGQGTVWTWLVSR